MFKRHLVLLMLGAALLLNGINSARAVMAVVDVRAIAQMAQQLRTLQSQLDTARHQLTQAQQQYQSTTGTRGMERILSGATRNYLPPNWQALVDAMNGLYGAYGSLASQLEAAVRGNSVLTPAQIARLSVQAREHLESNRKAVALLQVTNRQALESSSQRFASLQQLIDAIPLATDAKGVLDLQARISVEQAMLQNEQTKLQMMNQTQEAEARAREQRARELAIANFGSLRTRPAIGLNP